MKPASSGHKSQYRARAVRLPISAPLQYRLATERQWRRGTSINMSFTGMLIGVANALRAKDTVILRLPIPSELAGEAAPVIEIVCRVVRQNGENECGVHFLHAATGEAERNPAPLAPVASPFHSLMHDLAIIVGNCDILQHSTAMGRQTAVAVENIKRAAMKATDTLRKGAA
jgi:hypothetical protein